MNRIDWPQILTDLAWLLGEGDFGMPQARVSLGTRLLARALNVQRSTLVGWIDGSEPKHSDGEALLLRWCELTGKGRQFAPMERPPLSAARR